MTLSKNIAFWNIWKFQKFIFIGPPMQNCQKIISAANVRWCPHLSSLWSEWTAHFSIRLRHICHFRNLSGGELWWRTPGVPLRFLSIFWEKNLGVRQGYARGTPEVRHFRQPPASLVAPHTYCTETELTYLIRVGVGFWAPERKVF